MLLSILIPAAILGVLILAVVLFVQRGAGAFEATPRSLIRIYLYLASLVSIIVLVFGLQLTVTGALGAFAPEFTYGTPPVPRALPTPVDGRPPPESELTEVSAQRERQTRENLLQGITMAVAGALFWGVHWWGRRQVESADERRSALVRGYYLLGVAIFGVASIVLLPTAIYNALRYFLIPVGPDEFRQGVGESLAAAIVVVPIWLVYLSIVLADYRGSGRVPAAPVPETP